MSPGEEILLNCVVAAIKPQNNWAKFAFLISDHFDAHYIYLV